MDLSCLGEVEKLYHERQGKFEKDDWKKFVPDRTAVDKLKSRLLKVRQDEESSNLSLEIDVSKQQSNDEKGKQPLRSKSP